ncbi:MAG TPA: amino acid permease [archaeon]|nr:amino acid permease [archaeon]
MPQPKLKRELGLFEMVMYGVGIILGAGIYVLVGKAAGEAGNAVWMAFVLSAILASLTGLSFAELASMFPKSAGPYLYAKKAFGSKLFAFLIGWLMIFAIGVAATAVSLGFAGYFNSLFGTGIILTAALAIALMSLINFWGIKESAQLNIIFTSIEMLGLLIIIFIAIPHLGSVNYFEMPFGFSGVVAATILIFFAYLGFEDLVNVSEEVKNARKIVPLALLLSIAISSVLYILVSISAVSLLDWRELGASSAPLAHAAEGAFANSKLIISVIALFATFNTALFLLVAGSRLVYGISSMGALPRIFQAVHKARRTPWVAVAFLGILAIAFLSLGGIKRVAQLTDWSAFFVFAAINLAVVVLRYKEPHTQRPFKVPLSFGNFAVLPAIGFLFSAAMLFSFDFEETLLGLGIVALGAVVYFVLSKSKRF